MALTASDCAPVGLRDFKTMSSMVTTFNDRVLGKTRPSWRRQCLCLVFTLPSRRRQCLCLAFPLPSWRRQCLCLAFPLPSWRRQCLCLAFPLPSWRRRCLSLRSSGVYRKGLLTDDKLEHFMRTCKRKTAAPQGKAGFLVLKQRLSSQKRAVWEHRLTMLLHVLPIRMRIRMRLREFEFENLNLTNPHSPNATTCDACDAIGGAVTASGLHVLSGVAVDALFPRFSPTHGRSRVFFRHDRAAPRGVQEDAGRHAAGCSGDCEGNREVRHLGPAFPLPFHCLFTAFSLPFHCLSAAFSLPFHCLSTAFPLPFHCLFTAFPLPFHCLFLTFHCRFLDPSTAIPPPCLDLCIAFPLPFRCLSAAFPLPLHCLFIAFPLPFRCLFTAFSLPFHCLSAAFPLPFHCLSTAFPLPFFDLPLPFPRPFHCHSTPLP